MAETLSASRPSRLLLQHFHAVLDNHFMMNICRIHFLSVKVIGLAVRQILGLGILNASVCLQVLQLDIVDVGHPVVGIRQTDAVLTLLQPNVEGSGSYLVPSA